MIKPNWIVGGWVAHLRAKARLINNRIGDPEFLARVTDDELAAIRSIVDAAMERP